VAAVFALCALGMSAGQELGTHTDDGCRVEIHCLACRLALGMSAGRAVPAPDLAPPPVSADRLAPAPQQDTPAPLARTTPSRAPPLA
jgi:hypothetical protein